MDMKRVAMWGGAAVVLLSAMPRDAGARVDPLRVITERMMRSEILVVLDTSGSMAAHPSPAYSTGSDCGGSRPGTVDICGDGMCSGAEGTYNGTCTQDCPISSNEVSLPGMPPVCSPYYALPSRMFMVKRVMRNLLPDLRRSASLGLVTFGQSGYFRYYRGNPAATRPVTVFLSRPEMEAMGAWDGTLRAPRDGFVHGGVSYALLSTTSLGVAEDSLYARTDDMSVENRRAFAAAGQRVSDGVSSWVYRGSYYTFTQLTPDRTDVRTEATYQGPQFVDGAGVTWVYHRFGYYLGTSGLSYSNSGLVVQAMSADQSQAAQDEVLYQIMRRMNAANNGGLVALGGTPTDKAVEVAEDHFEQRQLGSGAFSGAGVDPASSCRGRYLLVLTDGQSNYGSDPVAAVQNLYNNATLASNPVKTLVVGLPGLPASAMSQLDAMADAGDDGLLNGSTTALFAADESTLLRVIKEALFEFIQGDYTTTPPGVSTSGEAYTSGDLAIVPSTEYPGWRGHLRAMDMTQNPPAEVWDAGLQLRFTAYNARRIYTGYPNSDNGDPVPLFSSYGIVNDVGGCDRCGPVGISQVWQAVGNPPTAHEMIQVVQWLAGRGRDWKLGPVVRSTPATVGPPPAYGLPDHVAFRKVHAARERLIYVTTNDGVLHAFRSKDGSEAFAYVPPNLWPKIYRLWQMGGHDTDPANVEWILGSSPRVEDIPPQSTRSWTTQLVLPMGPGGRDFVALDISNPSTCTLGQCQLNEPPFKVLAHSRDLTGLEGVMGEAWSTPALFYGRDALYDTRGQMAMGSGYGPGDAGSYYNFFPALYDVPNAILHQNTSALVDYALLADTTAVIDPSDRRRVIATYQADLMGRIVRYEAGRPSQASIVLRGGRHNPLYYGPAGYHMGGGSVVLAAASGSQDEADAPAGMESTLYLLREKDGLVEVHNDALACAVSDICTRGPGCPDVVPESCSAPSAAARPVSAPLLINNAISDGTAQLEAFYLLYDPPATTCAQGATWLVRVATEGATQTLIAATRYAGVRATGISLSGGGVDLAVSRIGLHGQKATAFNIMSNVELGALKGELPYVESWREVQ